MGAVTAANVCRAAEAKHSRIPEAPTVAQTPRWDLPVRRGLVFLSDPAVTLTKDECIGSRPVLMTGASVADL